MKKRAHTTSGITWALASERWGRGVHSKAPVCRLQGVNKRSWQGDMAFQSPCFFPLCQGDKGNQIRLFTPGSLSSPNLARVPGNDLLSHYPDTFRILIARHASGLLYPRCGEKSMLIILLYLYLSFFPFTHPCSFSIRFWATMTAPYSIVLS